jgi:hypothetical protein
MYKDFYSESRGNVSLACKFNQEVDVNRYVYLFSLSLTRSLPILSSSFIASGRQFL